MTSFRTYLNQFGVLPEQIYIELQGLFSKKLAFKKEVLIDQKEPATRVAFLETGMVRSFLTATEGKEFTKQFFIGPCFVGAYSSLITKQPSRVMQQALTDCTIWTAEYKEVERLYATYHAMETLGRKVAERYYIDKENDIIEMALYDATHRYLLLKQKFPDLEKHVQQSYIASYLSITPTQLSRIRKKLQTA